MDEARFFPVDIQTVKQYGIQRWQSDFFWPVSDLEFRTMTEAVEKIFTDHINHSRSIISDALLIKRNLYTEYTHFLHAVWVLERIAEQGYTPLYTKKTLWYRDLAKKTLSGKSGSLIGVRSTIFPTTIGSRFLGSEARSFIHSIRINGTVEKLWERLQGKKRGSIYGVPSHLVVDYLKKQRGWYSVTLPPYWIPPLLDVPNAQLEEIKKFAERIVEELATIARDCNIPLMKTHFNYLISFTESQLVDGVRAFASLCRFITQNRPQHLLVPILGPPLQRALALAVRRTGSRTTSFAHGGSVGLWNVSTLSLSEFALADEFVAYTKGSVELFERIQKNHPPLRGNRVHIIAAETLYYLKLWKRWHKISVPKSIRKVMVIGFPHGPWRKSHGTAAFSLMHLDFELRLMKMLKESGFDVIYKAHPDRLGEIHGIFEKMAIVIREDFQYTALQADAYIFGSLRTTAFPMALCTNKPIIFLQMQDECPRPFDDAMILLKKRCTAVRGWFDERNRIAFDPQEVLVTLARSPSSPNTEFIEKYLLP